MGAEWLGDPTYDQLALWIEAANSDEGRQLVRAVAGFNGLDDPEDAFPAWYGDGRASSKVEALDFSVSAQLGMVEAVERGLIAGDVWRRSVYPVWENLLAASGDLDAWRDADRKRRQRAAKGGGFGGG